MLQFDSPVAKMTEASAVSGLWETLMLLLCMLLLETRALSLPFKSAGCATASVK